MDSIKDVVRSSAKVPEFDKHLKKAGGHIGQNVVEITIKMKIIVWKLLMIKMKVTIIPIMIGTFGIVTKGLLKRLETRGFGNKRMSGDHPD